MKEPNIGSTRHEYTKQILKLRIVFESYKGIPCYTQVQLSLFIDATSALQKLFIM